MEFCNYCQRPYTPKRSDQKFCSSKCRNNNKNRRVKQEQEVFEPVLKILKKNYKILLEFLHDGAGEFELNELIELGFNPNYFTHTHRTTFELWRCIGDLKFSIHYFRQTENRVLIDRNE